MKVTNKATFDVLAFGWHNARGPGDDVRIPAGTSAEVNGPYLGEMGGGSCTLLLAGEVTCQETPDDDNGVQVLPGKPLFLGADDRGITIRHHQEPAEDSVLEWRECNQHRAPSRRADIAGLEGFIGD